MQEPCHVFHNPNFEPVTLSPRYFSAPLYQNLEFIIKIGYVQPKNRHVNGPDKDTLKNKNRTQVKMPHGNIKLTRLSE